MNKKALIFIAGILAAAFLFSGCVIRIDGLDISLGSGNRYSFDHSDKYTPGGGEITDTVRAIDIDWIGGEVKILTHGKNTVEFSESALFDIDSKHVMCHWLDGSTLRIKFMQAGKIDLSWHDRGKTLTMYVPKDMMLADLDINSVSTDIDIADISAEDMQFNTVSGDIVVENCSVTDSIDTNTTSGKIDVTVTAPLDEFKVNTVSGDAKIEAIRIKDGEFNSISGSITVTAHQGIWEMDMDSVSGNIKLYLPKDSGFTLEMETVSGNFDCELPSAQKNGRYICGSGEWDYALNSVSGNIDIFAN